MKKLSVLLTVILLVQGLNAQVFEKRIVRNQNAYTAQSDACASRINGNNLIAINAFYNQGSAALAEIDPSGDTVWMKQYKNSATTYGNIVINYIKELSDKRILLAGGIHTCCDAYTAFFALTDSLGNMQTFKQYYGQTSLNLTLTDVITGPDGAVYFTGSYYDIYSGGVSFYSWTVPMIGKLNPNLTEAWVYTVGSTTHTNSNRNSGIASGIKMAPDGTLLTYGYAEQDGTTTTGYTYLLKINTSGGLLWSRQQARLDDYPIGMEVLQDGSIYTFKRIGTASTVFGGDDLMVQKINAAGNLKWSKVIGTANSEWLYKLRYDNSGNHFLLAGEHNNTENDALFLKMDTSANVLVSKVWGQNNSLTENFSDIVRTNNKYIITGKDYLGAYVLQTDLNGSTTCSGISIAMQTSAYTAVYTSGVTMSGENITESNITTAKLNSPPTFNSLCFSCPATSSTITVSSCGNYTAPDGAVYTTSGTVTATINNSAGCDSVITINLTVNQVPAQPAAILGPITLCAGELTAYNIAPVSGATSYTWILPGDWTGTSTTDVIMATAGNNSGVVLVSADNGCGSSTMQQLSVVVNTPPSIPGSITGNTSVCILSTQTYSVAVVAGANSYTWTLPSGWSGTSTTNSITTTAGTTAGNISVTATNGCGTSAAQTLNINVNTTPSTPSAIAGNTIVCNGSSQNYSVTNDTTASSYTWILPSGWSGTSTSNTIATTAGATAGSISVTATNGCGTSAVQTLTVTVNDVPALPSVISGDNSICAGSTENYSVINDANATSYTWNLPAAWSGTSTNNSIAATSAAAGGTISVTANNFCGNSTAQTLTVTVHSLPTVTLSLNIDTVCIDNAVFAFSGGLPAGGAFSGSGVTGGNFNAATAGVGTHTITYTFTDGNGCTNTNTDQVTVDNCTGISNPEYPISNLAVYPNPFSNEISIEGSFAGDVTVNLISVQGQILRSSKITANFKLQTSSLPAGIYFLEIRNENTVAIKKIVKNQ